MSTAARSEFELIARLTADLPTREEVVVGIGDDCAVLDQGGPRLLLLTCDSQVEGVHFTFQTSSAEEIGRKALAINLSDIAAMGGEPRYALISLHIPRRCPPEVLDRLYAGLRQEAAAAQTLIIGGNVSGTGAAETLAIDITLLGEVERGHVLTRSGARTGDILFVTGYPGDSAAGLYSLLHPDYPYPPEACERLRAVHRVPKPRLAEGRLLSELGPEIVTALIDVSDGLSGDLSHICERSGVGACIDVARLPLSPELRSLATLLGRDPLAWVLHGGEDYELLFTVAPGQEQTVQERFAAAGLAPLTPIGQVTDAAGGLRLRWPDGREEPLAVQSWDHFTSPR
ncbi:thiamine-phosphate kinase [Thermogemmatispora sp.]|uniref:thiamine-phosphate kinase n=1 Tax=Thermogemmatispora sp. TaxID=1968838 RepID=UPI001D3540F7|nr:thiamine-phosphate kinase [Thermogemmatispora sp.]MBX5450231.1 thiamine-phosphate kinase [Thermogemmatispora sp.]